MTQVTVDLKAKTIEAAKEVAVLAEGHVGLLVAAHPRFATRLTVRGPAREVTALVIQARSRALVTADAAFEAAMDMVALFLVKED